MSSSVGLGPPTAAGIEEYKDVEGTWVQLPCEKMMFGKLSLQK
jgi:hypothetical protein